MKPTNSSNEAKVRSEHLSNLQDVPNLNAGVRSQSYAPVNNADPNHTPSSNGAVNRELPEGPAIIGTPRAIASGFKNGQRGE